MEDRGDSEKESPENNVVRAFLSEGSSIFRELADLKAKVSLYFIHS